VDSRYAPILKVTKPHISYKAVTNSLRLQLPKPEIASAKTMAARPVKMTFEDAEEIAIRALRFLADDMGRLERFLTLTGVGPHDLRAAGDDPMILAGVMEHLLSDEPQLLEFTANANLAPEAIQQAWDLLTLEAMRRKRS
jgi:Protein of unknown function (DUF3572)